METNTVITKEKEVVVAKPTTTTPYELDITRSEDDEKCKVIVYQNARPVAICTIFTSPFRNCQNWIIGSFNSLLNVLNVSLFQLIRDIRIRAAASKAILVIDVERRHVSRIGKELKIISQADYTSSNYSSMSILVIDTRFTADGIFVGLGNNK